METEESKKEPVVEQAPQRRKLTRKDWWKIGGIAAAALGLILIVGILLLDVVVAEAVRNIGPKLTGTPVTLESVSIKLFRGRFELNNLVVGNPPGYQLKNAFELKRLVVQVDVNSLMTKDIRVPEVLVNGMLVDFEPDAGGSSNLWKIRSNILDFLHRHWGGGPDEPSTDSGAASDVPAEPKEKTNVMIGLLTASDMQLCFGTAAAVALPTITLENFGGEKSLTKVVDEFFDLLLRDVSTQAARKGIQALGNSVDKALESENGKGLKGTVDELKKLF